tara:strand:+ start:193 stop:2445 length:2253 start_codon:yes stop_codon:yes gene_type:complete
MILPLLPTFETLDKIGPQFLFLSLSQLLISIYLFITSKNKEYKLTIIEICFLGLTFISLISFTASDFLLQSWIDFMRLLVYVIVFFNLTLISKRIKNFDQFVFLLLLLFLTFEVVAVLMDFLRVYDFNNPFGRSRELQGLSSNLNVGAFSILIKIPIALYFFDKLKPIFLKLLIWFVLFASFFSIFVMSSRGAMLGIVLFTFGFLIYLIAKYISNKNIKITNYNFTFLFYLFALGIAFASHTFLFQNKTNFKVANRIASFENDNSTANRFQYYKDALNVMLENPILGKGIGTWKIHSIEEAGDKLFEYEAPYHVHNDFLQYGAETGILGFLIYILIFLIPLAIIILQIVKKSFKLDSFKDFLIAGSIVIFIIDSSINFPKGRPFSMINILLILAVINYIYFSNFKFSFKSTVRTFQFYFILLLIPISFHNYKIFLNLKDQVFLYIDYNLTKDFSRSLSIIDKIETNYDNLSVSAYPIYNQLANYYIFQGKPDKAIDFARRGKKANPFFFTSENQIGQAYYNKNELDSAYYYCKRAFDKRPNNSSHVTHLQRVLAAQKAPIEGFNDIYNIVKNNSVYKNRTFWTNHLQAIIYTKNYQNFTEDDKQIANDAKKLFPDDNTIETFNQLINYGVGVISYSNKVDEDAQRLFEKGEFKEAIALWEKSIEVLPVEDAYYLNIAQAYISMEKSDIALRYLRMIEQLDIKEKNGKFEFLLGLYFLDKGKTNKACKVFSHAKNLGFSEAISVYELLKCN